MHVHIMASMENLFKSMPTGCKYALILGWGGEVNIYKYWEHVQHVSLPSWQHAKAEYVTATSCNGHFCDIMYILVYKDACNAYKMQGNDPNCRTIILPTQHICIKPGYAMACHYMVPCARCMHTCMHAVCKANPNPNPRQFKYWIGKKAMIVAQTINVSYTPWLHLTTLTMWSWLSTATQHSCDNIVVKYMHIFLKHAYVCNSTSNVNAFLTYDTQNLSYMGSDHVHEMTRH